MAEADDYVALLYTWAKVNGSSIFDIRRMTYAQVAVACEVKIEANGDSPANFLYESIKQQIASRLDREETAEADAAEAALLEEQLKKLTDYIGAAYDYLRGPDGEVILTITKVSN